MVRGIKIMQKFWILTFSARRAREQTHARDMYGRKILKCSKWPETCSPLIRFGFWAFLNFDVRVVTRTGMWIVRLLENGRKFMCSEYVDLGWMIMKIWMITWIHKMAPGWRHGWVMTRKSLLVRFGIRTKILWKFENHSDRNFWVNRLTKLIRNKGKINK